MIEPDTFSRDDVARLVWQQAAAGICVIDAGGEIVEANERFALLIDRARPRGLALAALIDPEDRPLLEARRSDPRAALAGEFSIEVRLIRADGNRVWTRGLGARIAGRPGFVFLFSDITDERNRARARRADEDRFGKLADSMPQIVWTANVDGKLDYFNRKWLDYSGTSHADNEGFGWARAVHPEDLPGVLRQWFDGLASGASFAAEIRLRGTEGNYRWHVSRAVAARDPDGRIEKWYGTWTDIHESKVMLQELETARRDLETEQQKLRTIFKDSSTSMAVLKGADLVYEILNTSYADLFPGREILGRPFIEALPELVGQAFPKIAARVFETGEAYFDREAKAMLRRRADGPIEECYFDQSYTRVDDQYGNPYGVYIHAREVTDLVRARREIEESAERFRVAVETADMGTWDLDPRTWSVRWSARAGELFGVAEHLTLTYAEAGRHVHPEDQARVAEAVRDALDPRREGHYAAEYRIRPPSGEIRWVSALGQAFFDDVPDGRVATRLTGVILDVTDRVMNEVALRDAKERAETANAAKSAFLANMSHEIRTPLGAVMGFVGLMRDDGLDRPTLLEYVTIIERNSVQLMRIIDDILDLSKVEAGMMQIEHVDFSLVELLSDFGSLMGFRAREKGVTFEVKATTELPELVNADPTRIRQILTNVVGNAIKFTEVGRVELFVRYDAGQIEFEVRDTGRGITPEQRDSLFKPFAQADVSTTRKFGGTGLGLVLTRRLAEAMGGRFDLRRSSPGAGSTFVACVRVDLPAGSPMVRALGFATEATRETSAPGLLKGLRVLLVEDSPDNQALFSIYLSRAGAQIAIAGDGARGVEMALRETYDVVLMDVQMPIMDGITATQRLRAAGFAVPIIALTAHAMKEERVRCLRAGYTDFLSKPIARADLIKALVNYVNPADRT